MKRIFQIVLLASLVFPFFTVDAAGNDQKCDQTFYATLRYGKSYQFFDTVKNTSEDVPFNIRKVDVIPPAFDYNGPDPFPQFKLADWLTAADRPQRRHSVVMPGESGRLVTATSRYKIDAVPTKRDPKNMLIKYNMHFSDWRDGSWQPEDIHTECQYYEISWCGDGVLETKYGEQCDPNDKTKKNWGTDGCSVTCKPKNKPHTSCDQTFYNKLRHTYSYTLQDKFENTGEVDLKLDSFTVSSDGAVDFSDRGFPNFSWGVSNYVVGVGKTVTALKATSSYGLNKYPTERKKDNILVKYQIGYYAKDSGKFDLSTKYYHNECQYYEITRCGDGIVDDYTQADGIKIKETCDPADPNKTNWGDGGCDTTTCEPVSKPAECEELTVSTVKPLTTDDVNFSCKGFKADSYKVVVKNKSGAVVKNFVSNTGTFKLDAAGEYTATCYVNNTLTAPACTKTIKVEVPKIPECRGITVTPSGGTAPVNSDIVCNGVNTNDYKIDVFYGSQTTPDYSVGQKTANFNFTKAGTYTAVCYAATKTNDACRTTVEIKAPIRPEISVDKKEANRGQDIRPNYSTTAFATNDVQTVTDAETAYFTITVENTGTEDLKDVVLTDDVLKDDRDAPSCNKTKAQTAQLLRQAGNRDTVFNVGEKFSYQCERTNTQKDYINKIMVTGVGVTSNETVNDDDTTKVETQKPDISVEKLDGNTNDIRPEYRANQGFIPANDVQTVVAGNGQRSTAVFTIKVKNTGTEPLKDVVLTDKVEGEAIDYCGGRVSFSDKKIKGTNTYNFNYVGIAGNHNNTTLEPEEEIVYTCSVPNTTKNYTNTIFVQGTGVYSGEKPESDDPSYVEVLKPEIDVEKMTLISAHASKFPNYTDRDAKLGDDTQTVLRDQSAVFTIIVKNTGTETLKAIKLTDKVGGSEISYCGGTVDLRAKKVGQRYDLEYVESPGNHNNPFLEPGESFRYSCEVPETEKSYTNEIFVEGTGIYSGDTPKADDPAEVVLDNNPYPSIGVEKKDGNSADLEPNYTSGNFTADDVQVVEKGQKAVFDIIVTNTGNEDLKNIVLTDKVGDDEISYCAGAVDLVAKKVNGTNTYTLSYVDGSGNAVNEDRNKDALLQSGESFTYKCEVPNTQAEYVNTIIVEGEPVTSSGTVGDSDPSKVETPKKYDLALRKTYDNSQEKGVGKVVTFVIEVFNQGGLPAKDITITDYIPSELELVSTDWTANSAGTQATYTITDTILPTNSKRVEIKFRIKSIPSSKRITNLAEISADDGDDCDSTPDNNKSNDGRVTDNDIGSGCDEGGDEDDHDPASITFRKPTNTTKECTDFTPKGPRTISRSSYSQEYTCKGTDKEMKIDCGNGQVFTTDNATRVNGSYTFKATCNFSRGSSRSKKFTPSCTVIDSNVGSCPAEITLRRGGGGGGGNPTNPNPPRECDKDGIVEIGEECDEGPTGGPHCTEDCKLKPAYPDGYCGDGDVDRKLGEECDLGSDNATSAWCKSCKINPYTQPGATGYYFGPDEHKIIGLNTDIFKQYNTKKFEFSINFKDSNKGSVYVDGLCLVAKGEKDIIDQQECIRGKTLYRGDKLTLDPKEVFKTKRALVGTNDKQRDNTIYFTWGKPKSGNDYETFENTYLKSTYKLRVAKPSVVTTGGGTSYVRDTSGISNTSTVVTDIVNPTAVDRNQNTASVSVSQGLSGTTTEVTSSNNIAATTGEGDDYNTTVTANTTNASNSGAFKPLDLNKLSRFESYRGVEGAYLLKGNHKITSFDKSKIDKPTTFVIEGGDLEIAADIVADTNIAFVVKGGDIKIIKKANGQDVEKLTGTYIAIPNNGGGNITSNESSKQLVINGSLYGNINGLTTNRTYLKQNGNQLDVGTIVSFGSSVFRKPAPLTSSFINEYLDATKVAR